MLTFGRIICMILNNTPKRHHHNYSSRFTSWISKTSILSPTATS
ncbi:Uncharacterised protein [Moraxella veridica]|nr:Uncharacterised protein [Moraxella catarrhalis]